MKHKMHQDELPISIKLVRQLVDQQFPQYADLPLEQVGTSGSSNIQFRLGENLIVRLPRQRGGSSSIEKEFKWTPIIGAQLPVAVPEFVGLGEPALGYSERWSIMRWLDGERPMVWSLDRQTSQNQLQLVNDLAEVILSLRRIEFPPSSLENPQFQSYRGRSLKAYDSTMRARIEQCRLIDELDLDFDKVLLIWEEALTLPDRVKASQAHWFHGDLVAENLLLKDGRLFVVLDFGGLGLGDPTIDLHGAWELFNRQARQAFRVAIGAGEAEWLRGRAWALAVAIMTFPYYWRSLPRRVNDRLAMVRSALEEVD
ncbi:MAG: aminoglycoside phosphotransferase family protein [Chloroflexota bacterium]